MKSNLYRTCGLITQQSSLYFIRNCIKARTRKTGRITAVTYMIENLEELETSLESLSKIAGNSQQDMKIPQLPQETAQ